MTKKTKKEVQIIFKKTFSKLEEEGSILVGKKGSVAIVNSGYARNYLIPQEFAEIATPSLLKNLEFQQKKQQKEDLLFLEECSKKKAILEQSSEFILRKRTNEDNKIFGKISAKQVLDLLETKTNLVLKNTKFSLPEITSLGKYEISLSLHPEVKAKIVLEIVAI